MSNQNKNPKKLNKVTKIAAIVCAVLIGFIILIVAVSSKSAQDKEEANRNAKWSEMKLGYKKEKAEHLCQDANNYVNKINLDKYDIISLRYSWDSWSSIYKDWSSAKDEVQDGNKAGQTKEGLPVYNYNWNGNRKDTTGKEKVVFSCYFSVDENNDNKMDILWLTVDDLTVQGAKNLAMPE